MTQNVLLQKHLIFISKILMYIIVIITSCILVGHLFSPTLLSFICWDKTPMASMAALAYLLVSVAYLLKISADKTITKTIISNILSCLLIILGITVLILQFTGYSIFFLSQVVNKNTELTNTIKIPPIATCFIIYGISVLLLDYQTAKKRMVSQYLVIPTTILGGFLFLAFLYNTSIIVNGVTDVPVSIYAAFFNITIPFAIFFAHPDKGIAGEVTKTKTGSKTLLNLLPTIIVVPIFIGLLHLIYFPSTLGLALIILLFISFCILIIYNNLKIINRDIQERLMVQSELKESIRNVSYLTDLLERSTDAIMMIDKNYNIKQWNKGAEIIYGYTANEVIGKNKYELLDASFMTAEQFEAGVDMLFLHGGERTSTRQQQSKSGKTLTILQSAVALYSDNKELIGYIGIGKDITELEEKEKELASLNIELDKLVKAKTTELSSVYERISDAIIVLDTNWCYTYLNKMAYIITQRTAHVNDSLIGKNIWKEFPFIINTTLSEAYYKAKAEQISIRLEYYYTEFDMWTEQTIYPTPDGISVFLRDITEQKLAAIKQEDAEEKYKTIVETSQEGILIRDTNGIITFVNEYLVKMLKESREYLIGLPLLNLFSDENLKIMQYNMERRNQGLTDTYDITLPLRDGSIITVYVKSTPYYEKGVFAGSLSSITDITNIKNKEIELKRLTSDLRSLSFYLQNIREEERKKIAQEIHDELGQNLAILKMDASWISRKIETDDNILIERLEQFKKITDETVQTSRRLYNHLYPQMLDDIGLVGAINWHSDNYIRPNNIEFIINTDLTEHILPQYHNIWLGLYRIYQECTTNILRYANAKTITLDLNLKDQNIVMVINDDGAGFELDKVDTKIHHGLLGMRERVYSLEGTIQINSVINQGTTITVIIPILETIDNKTTTEYLSSLKN